MKKNHFLACFIPFFLSCILTHSVFAQRPSASSEAMMDSVFAKYNNKTGPGCAVAVIRDGKVIFKKAYGMANLEYSMPLTPASVFDVASLSKQFTGYAIATLIQQGKLSEDDDIRKYLPNVPDFGEAITVRRLLHHTSGVRDWPNTLVAAGWKWSEEASFEDIMRMVYNQTTLNFKPGAEYSYSNTGYNLLAAVVENITRISFREWTQKNIFQPLGMHCTLFLDNLSEIIPDVVDSYTYERGQWGKMTDVLTAYGSSSLYSSIDDLCRWVIHFQQGIQTKDPVILQMLRQDTLLNGNPVHYGYGVEMEDDRGLYMIRHTGAWAGFRTTIRNYPAENTSFILLSNGGDNTINNVYSDVVTSIFLPGKFKQAPQPHQFDTTHLHFIRLDSMALSKFAGSYKWGGAEVVYTVEKGQLIFQYTGEMKLPTKPITDTSFFLPRAGLPITFGREKDGTINTFTFRDRVGKRFQLHIPTTAELAEYAGSYSSSELQTTYTITVESGRLVIHHFRRGDFVMSSDVKDEFNGDIGTLHFTRRNNAVTGFSLSINDITGLRFDKWAH